MRQNSHVDALYASRLIQELETQCNPSPLLGLAFMSGYVTALGLFLYWMLA